MCLAECVWLCCGHQQTTRGNATAANVDITGYLPVVAESHRVLAGTCSLAWYLPVHAESQRVLAVLPGTCRVSPGTCRYLPSLTGYLPVRAESHLVPDDSHRVLAARAEPHLVLAEGVDERLEDEGEVGHQLGARLLFERCERRARRLLHPLVAVQHPLEQLRQRAKGEVSGQGARSAGACGHGRFVAVHVWRAALPSNNGLPLEGNHGHKLGHVTIRSNVASAKY